MAALEAMIALRRMAQERVAARAGHADSRVGLSPAGGGRAVRARPGDALRPGRMARDHGAAMHLAGVQAVRPGRRTQLVTWDGRTLGYELLVVAVGALPDRSLPGSVTIKGPGYTGRFRTVLRELEERRVRRVAFAVPAGASWPLPLYELALMTAAHVRRARPAQRRAVARHPRAGAARAVRHCRLGGRARAARGARHGAPHQALPPGRGTGGELVIVPERVAGGRPRGEPARSCAGRRCPGFRRTPRASSRPTSTAWSRGELDVYAAGDATTCPIKQGGIAAQQADAAAEAIAARLGRRRRARALPAGAARPAADRGQPRFLRAEVSGTASDPRAVSDQALWWPPEQDRRPLARALSRARARRARGAPAAPGGGRRVAAIDARADEARPRRGWPSWPAGRLGTSHGRSYPRRERSRSRAVPPTRSTRSSIPIARSRPRVPLGSKPVPSSDTSPPPLRLSSTISTVTRSAARA